MRKLFCCFFVSTLLLNLSPVFAGEEREWKEEFGIVCGGTQGAVSLSVEKLQEYIDRCDKLEERLDELKGGNGSTEKKVYTRRLKMCRDVYQYTLQYKNREE